jgi:hypothetical protein
MIPIFRIAAALAILWLIKPEVISAPVSYVASSALDLVGAPAARDAREAAELLARSCKAAPEACRAIAAEALRQAAPPTGSIRTAP